MLLLNGCCWSWSGVVGKNSWVRLCLSKAVKVVISCGSSDLAESSNLFQSSFRSFLFLFVFLFYIFESIHRKASDSFPWTISKHCKLVHELFFSHRKKLEKHGIRKMEFDWLTAHLKFYLLIPMRFCIFI